jgi:hypothetical protein
MEAFFVCATLNLTPYVFAFDLPGRNHGSILYNYLFNRQLIIIWYLCYQLNY